MQRYLVHKEALNVLGNTPTLNAFELHKPWKVKDEGFHFNHIPYLSIMLSDEHADLLKQKDIYCRPEQKKEAADFLLQSDYQRTMSYYFRKPLPRLITGINPVTGLGIKVAIIGTGCNQTGTKGVTEIWLYYNEGYNFIDDTTDVTDTANHDTPVTSIINSSIGNCTDLYIYALKVYNGTVTESSLLAAVDYCITNNVDIVNMSFQFDSDPFASAVAALYANGSVIVASAGNSTTITNTVYPAAYPNVVAVNSFPEDGQPYHKNINAPDGGHGINIACNGRNCQGIYNSGIIGICNGTSFSAPFYTGGLASYWSQWLKTNPAITIQEMNAYLLNVRGAIKSKWHPYFGIGMFTW